MIGEVIAATIMAVIVTAFHKGRALWHDTEFDSCNMAVGRYQIWFYTVGHQANLTIKWNRRECNTTMSCNRALAFFSAHGRFSPWVDTGCFLPGSFVQPGCFLPGSLIWITWKIQQWHQQLQCILPLHPPIWDLPLSTRHFQKKNFNGDCNILQMQPGTVHPGRQILNSSESVQVAWMKFGSNRSNLVQMVLQC